MQNFTYEAVNKSGKKTTGIIRTASKQAAISELRARGLNIRSVQEKKAGLFDREISIGRAVQLEDFVVFCRQFATLIRSGIQIDQSLDILEDQTSSKKLKEALSDVMTKVREGQQMSQAMELHPRIFPEMFVNMIASGEVSGNMDGVLDRMADHYEKEHATIQKIKSAMMYPIIVLIIAIGVVTFLLISIVPSFASMFAEQGAELPWITRFVMGASDFIIRFWWLCLLMAIGFAFLFRMVRADEEGRYMLDNLRYKIPLFGQVLRKATIARVARSLSSLYMSGVPVLQALEITGKVVNCKVYGQVIVQTREGLSEGRQLSDPFEKSGLFPKMVTSMLSVGEETGQIDGMLEKTAEFFESDVEQAVDRLKSTIEPLMLLIVSLIVGIIVAAIMSPMFAMYDNFLG